MNVRAKMYVTGKATNPDGETGTVYLAAVYEENGINKTWAKYTPCASVSLTIDNPPAFAAFTVGGYYFVDFSETTKE